MRRLSRHGRGRMRWVCLLAAASVAGSAGAAEPAKRPAPRQAAATKPQPAPEPATVKPPAPEEPKLDNQRLSIPIYNGGQPRVQDRRSLDLPGGRRRIELREVSNQI